MKASKSRKVKVSGPGVVEKRPREEEERRMRPEKRRRERRKVAIIKRRRERRMQRRGQRRGWRRGGAREGRFSPPRVSLAARETDAKKRPEKRQRQRREVATG